MNNIMGCEIISPDPVEFGGYRKLLKKMDLHAIKVPVRMNGLTSSGTIGKCYYNVDNLVEVFGGKTVVGWAVNFTVEENGSGKKFTQNITIRLHGHAVWLNEEGDLSDPTAKSWEAYEQETLTGNKMIWGAIRENGKVYRQFIPIKVGDPIECYGCETILHKCKKNWKGQIIDDWKNYLVLTRRNNIRTTLEWREISPRLLFDQVLYQENWRKNFKTWDAFCEYRRRIGVFHEKSLSTGRSLNEIRQDRLSRQ